MSHGGHGMVETDKLISKGGRVYTLHRSQEALPSKVDSSPKASMLPDEADRRV